MKTAETTKAKRIVIKVGTSTLTHDTGRLDLRKMEKLAKVISDLCNDGREIILVSSGAQSAGVSRLGLHERPESREGKQAVAAVGQCELMNMYGRFFAEYGKTTAQVLLTKHVWENEEQRKNAAGTFDKLLEMKCVPIVNENDTVSYEGIAFGGNDILASYVALITSAQLLINLSDIDGLFDKDPRKYGDAKLIERVDGIDDAILRGAEGSGTKRGTGGMTAKLQSAQMLSDIPMVIANGKDPDILYGIVCDGEFVGTYFSKRG